MLSSPAKCCLALWLISSTLTAGYCAVERDGVARLALKESILEKPVSPLRLFSGGGVGMTGVATKCRIHNPFGIDFDRAGNAYIAEMAGGERVLRVDRLGNLTVLAGTGEKGDGGDDGPAIQARFNGMHSLAIGPGDDVFIADTWNNRIRRIDIRNGTISAFAGTGKRAFSGDGGPAQKAELGNTYCVAFDPSHENLFIADLDNRRIRAVNLKSGMIETVAGNGQRGVPPDGAKATEAPLVDPRAVAIDSTGSLYILERSGHALRKVDRDGIIRTAAGTGQKGSADGEARKATFNGPKHLCIDSRDDVIIADTDNHVIRKYLPRENRVVRIAGDDAGEFRLNQPHGVHVDPNSGTLYITDSLNNRVLKTEAHRYYTVLRHGPTTAIIADNSGSDNDHRAGYHGLVHLSHELRRLNAFVGAYSGLNFEHIHDGTTQDRKVLFEPRFAPMDLLHIDSHTAELHQPPTPYWGLESWIRYELLENSVVQMTFTCTPHRVTWKNNYLGLFFASYIDQPKSLDIHFLNGQKKEAWVQGISPSHGVLSTHRAANDNRDFPHDPEFPLSLVFSFSNLRYDEPWFFGESHGMALAQIFRPRDQIRFSQSPSGGGNGNPAWDFQFFIADPKVGERYQIVMRMLYLPFPEAPTAEAAREKLRSEIRRSSFAQ
jgi:sugar lactone lactonase YvrE